MAKFKVGTAIEWKWGAGHVEGHVVEVFEKSISRTIKGKKITRHGTKEKPAYLIKSSKGVPVLKLESEIQAQKSYSQYKAERARAK